MPFSQSVLIVEDDADLRRMYRVALTMAGYLVHVAIDGLDALRQTTAPVRRGVPTRRFLRLP